MRVFQCGGLHSFDWSSGEISTFEFGPGLGGCLVGTGSQKLENVVVVRDFPYCMHKGESNQPSFQFISKERESGKET